MGNFTYDEPVGKSFSYDDTPKQPIEGISRLSKIGQGMIDPINGGAQLLTKLLPSSVVEQGNRFNNWLADKTGLVARLPEGGVNQQVRDDNSAYEAKRQAAGESGLDGYRLLGNIASPMNLAIASRLPSAATTASLGLKTGLGAVGGSLSALMNPVTSGDDFASDKLKQMALGGAFGGALPTLGKAISSVISPAASKNPQLQLLRSEGITPTIGQTLGGSWNKLEEKAQSIPILGDMISNARQSAGSDLEKAAYNRALRPIGQEIPKNLSGNEAIAHTENALKDSYDNVLGKIGAIIPDKQFNENIANLNSLVGKQMIPSAEKDKFYSALNDISQSIDKKGVITSDSYKALESSLGSDARKLYSSQNIYEGKMAPAVKQLQMELKDMLQRQAGDGADELNKVNLGWANFKRLQDAASKIGTDNGSFSPAQLQNSVKSLGGKAQFARGDALMQDLSGAGKSILSNKVPDSGTAGRALLGGGALAASYLANPMIPLGLAGSAAMYAKPIQGLLGSAITSRPQNAQLIANSFENAAPMFAPFTGQVGLDFLNNHR